MTLGGLGELLGKDGAAQQLFIWQVVAQLLGAVLAPELELVTREVNKLLPATPLSPAQLADMVVRNIVDHAQAAGYATESGVSKADFERMVASAGEAPSPQELIAALRRGVIERDGTGPASTSFVQGIAESRLYNKWLPVIESLSNVPLGVADAVDAVVESQISPEQGQHFAYLNGVSAEDFTILVNTRGNPPSPTELNELLRRGLIPLEGTGPDALSFEQGIAEGATKTKWWRLLHQLGDYVTPPRTVVAMLKEGSITQDQALAELAKSGLDQEHAAAYLLSASHQKTQSTRDLTVSQVLSLYKDRLVDQQTASQMLVLQRYTEAESAYLLDLADFEVLQAKVREVVSKVHTLYVGHKLDDGAASRALDGAGVPPAGRDEYLTKWKLERAANVQTFTTAEVADAFHYGLIQLDDAISRLVNLGWTEEDALIRIEIREHGPLQPATPPTQ